MSRRSENTRERIVDAARTLVMENGFAGTSIDDILRATDLTKGAFFHYFRGKADLARELVEDHTRRDLAMFERFEEEAEAASDDPLERLLFFLKAFEAEVSRATDVAPGCMYAVYTYEGMTLDPAVRQLVAASLRQWTDIYARKFQDVIDRYPPALPVTAGELAEAVVSIIEGGLVLQRAYGDARMTARQSEQLRNYLRLLFGEPKPARRRRRASAPRGRKAAVPA